MKTYSDSHRWAFGKLERGKKDKKGQIKCSTDQSDVISQFGLSVAIKMTKNSGCLSVISSNCD